MVYNDTQKMNVFGEIIVYLLSIVVPIGVILITKKKGNAEGKFSADYSGSFFVGSIANKLRVLTAAE